MQVQNTAPESFEWWNSKWTNPEAAKAIAAAGPWRPTGPANYQQPAFFSAVRYFVQVGATGLLCLI
jgi:hypothetical protein